MKTKQNPKHIALYVTVLIAVSLTGFRLSFIEFAVSIVLTAAVAWSCQKLDMI